MLPREAGRDALAHIDAALAKRPEKDGHTLSAALRCLSAFRDELVAERRQAPEGDGSQLATVNAVISVVLAVQYPLGEMQWQEMVKSRAWLAAVVARSGS